MQTGLVSITFRHHPVDEIIALCVKNNLPLIEWGGDLHVPHGDLRTAASVATATRAAGLSVSAYGSYYRLGQSAQDGLAFTTVLETAIALDSPAIRVWPGTIASSEATPAYRAAIRDEALSIADLAAQKNILVCYELHANTLTDTTASALDLLEKTTHPAIRTLWQPYNGQTTEQCLDCLQTVLPWLHYAHVFHWHPDRQRQPLADGQARWTRYLKILRQKNCPLLLEFVRDDDPAQLSADAQSLHELINAA